MVSRGIISISDDELALLGYTGFESRKKFEEYIRINVMRALPLRIIYQGLLYELNAESTLFYKFSTIPYYAECGEVHVVYNESVEATVYSGFSAVEYYAECGHGYVDYAGFSTVEYYAESGHGYA